MYSIGPLFRIRELIVSDSVSDPDSCPDPRGSALILVGWFPIRIRIGNADPDPGGLKRFTKIEKSPLWIMEAYG